MLAGDRAAFSFVVTLPSPIGVSRLVSHFLAGRYAGAGMPVCNEGDGANAS
jgi:hypothetical protein